MLFCSQAFLLFFLLVFTAYWTLPWQRARVWLLVLASLYFYACWNKWLACLLALSPRGDYFLARGMDRFAAPRMQLGVEYFLMGLFKKLAIADRMAVFVDPVFADPGAFRSEAIWIAMFAYALQVYGDFSGYTDMALGIAHMLGYKLAQNFNMP